MAKYTNQDFIRGSGSTQNRALTVAGLIASAVIVVAIVATLVLYPRITAPSGTELRLVVPTLGPGVKEKSKVLLRGAEVGVVKSVDATSPDTVKLDIVLSDEAIKSLTDSVEVDYRPANYFGITAVNLLAKPGGSPLRAGQTLSRSKVPDFTMSTMIEHGSTVVDGTLDRQMIATLDKVTQYATGLAPLIETMIVVSDNVARTQKQLPSTLLAKMNDLTDVFPDANKETLRGLDALTNSVFNRMPDGSRGVDHAYHKLMDDSLTVAADGLFGAVGELLGSHKTELLPFVTSIKYLVDPVGGIMGGPNSMRKLTTVVNKLQSTFAGPPGEQELRLKIVLDSVPSVSQTLSSMGVRPASNYSKKQAGATKENSTAKQKATAKQKTTAKQKQAEKQATGESGRGN